MSFTERFKKIDWQQKARQAGHAAGVAKAKARQLAEQARVAIHEATAPSGHTPHAPTPAYAPAPTAPAPVAHEPVAHTGTAAPAKGVKRTWKVSVEEDGEETVLDEFTVRATDVHDAQVRAGEEAEQRGWQVQYAGHNEERGANSIFVWTRTDPSVARAKRKADERRTGRSKSAAKGKTKRR